MRLSKLKYQTVTVVNVVSFMFLFVLSFKSPDVCAQSDSSSSVVFFRNLINDNHGTEESMNDSTLVNTFFFDRVRQYHPFIVITGNPGSAHLNLFSNHSASSVLNDGFNQFDGYLLSPFKSLPGKAVPKRFTLIDYHIASKKEQHIMLNHEQHISESWHAGIDFGAMSSPGDFSRQLNTNRNFRIWNAYESRKGTYRNYVSLTTNRVNNQDNGGITSDSIFENASSLDTRTLPIYLRNAESTLKTRNVFVKQELGLIKLFSSFDSTEHYSRFGMKDLVLSHSFHYNRKSFLFESADPDSGYFTNFYIDSLQTKDTMFFGQFVNELLLTYSSGNSAFSYFFGGGVTAESAEYLYDESEFDFARWHSVVHAGFESGNYSMSVKGSFLINGEFEDTRDIHGNVKARLVNGKLMLHLGGSSGRYAHSMKDYNYHSNHFRWNNSFEPLLRSSAYLNIFLPSANTGLTFIGFIDKNRLLYREDYLPQVYSKRVTYGKVSLFNQLKLGKFRFDSRAEGAWSGNDNVVSVPNFSLLPAIYFTDVFFKRALGFKAGVDVLYQTAYNGYGYMPATGVFYIQNEKKIGNYPLASIFVNLQIKTASLFIRIDHLNAGIGERNYYGAYGYPLQGRTLKFGVNWSLTD